MYASKRPSGANVVATASDSKSQQPNPEVPIRDVEGQQFERVQKFSHGDSRVNNSDKTRSPPCHPERFDAGEHMRQLDRQSSCQCKLHPEMQNQAPRPETSQQQQGRGGASFTPEMVKDQEYLVTSMSQQGIPEPMIRRQFERLLEEQAKQLRLFEPSAEVTVERKPSSRRMRQTPAPAVARVEPCGVPETRCSRPESVAQPVAPMQYHYQQPQQQQQYWHPGVRADQQQEQPSSEAEPQQPYHQLYHQHQQQHQAPQPQQQMGGDTPAAPSSVNATVNNDSTEDTQTTRRQRLVEPSTLVRLRREKEQSLARAKNNGLQDPDASPALEALAKSRAEASKQRATQLRLNGTQEHDEMGEQLPLLADFDAEAYMRAQQQQQAASRGCRSNGLENSRSPSNPMPTRRSLQALKARQRLADAEEIVPCYPPQKAHVVQSQPQQQYQLHQLQQQQQQQMVESREQMVEHQQQQLQQEEHHQQQQQQQYQHWQMVQHLYEPKMQGGIVFNARKPSCVNTMPCTSTYANCCAPHSHHCTSTVG